jgi:hypothetical protein
VTVGATLVASLLAVLERPATWPLGLLGFLVRGGLVLVLAPIVVLPTAIGVANIVAPYLTAAMLRGLTLTVVLLIVVVGTNAMVWLLGGGLLAAAAESEGIRRIEPELAGRLALPAGRARRRRGSVLRILVVRLAAYLPLFIVLAWAASRVAAVIYREFTVPVETVTPLIVRVARAVPEAIALIIVAWLVGEVLGAIAARRIVLGGESSARALWSAFGHVGRRPLQTIVEMLIPLAALGAVLVPSAAAAAAAWTAIRTTLVDGLSPFVTMLAVLLLVAVLAGQLLLLSLVTAWRAAVWTVEVGGTFGGVGDRREGG